MFNSVFKIVYFAELMLATIVRKIYTSGKNNSDLKIQKKTKAEVFFLILNGIGMIIPIVYVFSSVLDFADYTLPDWLAWTGVAFFAFAIFLLWKSHYDLGKNWTIVPAIRKEHVLVTKGVYTFIRHPMYTAHLVWAIAQIMILHNWIAGYSFLIVQIPFYWYRIRNEEKMMIEQFGSAYASYCEKTYRIIPGLL